MRLTPIFYALKLINYSFLSILVIRALEELETRKFFLEDRGQFSEKRKIENVNIFWKERKCTSFILKSEKKDERVYTISISPETLTSYFDLALNKRNALSFEYNRTVNVFVDVNVGSKKHSFKFPLILAMYNIMIVMQNLKFIQDITFAINVECLHSSLQAKLLMHNCARAKNAKSCFCSILSNLKAQSSGK